MKLAICNDIHEFQGNRLLNQEWAFKFPGAGWVYLLNEKAKNLGWEVASGDIALTNIQAGYWDAKEVFVIQELDSKFGSRIISMGANPLVLTSLESPLYASLFYDRLPELILKFPEWMAPKPVWLTYNRPKSGRYWPLRFPCFSNSNQNLNSPTWAARKKCCLIAANKYWSNQGDVPSIFKIRQFASWVKARILIAKSSSRKYAIQNQLHDKRLELIEYFSRNEWLDLYGRGWDDLGHLPEKWQKRLKEIRLNDKGVVLNKLSAIAQYQFSICYENISAPGYITEKIIECMLAETIPIYLGASDINLFLPRECYIDARQFSDPQELHKFMINLSGNDVLQYLEAGQSFLKSSDGQAHSYEKFSDWIIDIAKRYEEKIQR
jgi:Glycosyltransferase family 10 (fucosyltransferase) C-term